MPRPRTKTRPRRQVSIEVDLMMECVEEALSYSQVQAQKKAEKEYQAAKKEIELAKATAVAAEQANAVTAPVSSSLMTSAARPEASSSPDIIIVDEEPPRSRKSTSSAPRQRGAPQRGAPQKGLTVQGRTTTAQSLPAVQTLSAVGGSGAKQLMIPASQQIVVQQPFTQFVSNTGVTLMARPALGAGNVSVAPGTLQVTPGAVPRAPLAGTTAPQQWQITNVQGLGMAKEVVSGTGGHGGKRTASGVTGSEPPKKAGRGRGRGRPSAASSLDPGDSCGGTLVPLDEFYYGKKEGDPAYREEKGEYRFKCWYCHKMLYNNLRIMMHMQGHIDSEKQQNLDLSDLTQCQHCYKQFDTPFEMQCHVEKVHQNKSNILVCRICEKDVDSQGILRQHMKQHHAACEMPYICQLCNFRSSIYSDVVDHFKKRHDSSQYVLCLYCLKVFKISLSKSAGWGLTQNYYIHLQKHQSRVNTKKCSSCKLTFLNKAEAKLHRSKDHMPNYKGTRGTNTMSTTGSAEQVMICLPDATTGTGRGHLKSLNAPSSAKVLDLRAIKFNGVQSHHVCFECKGRMQVQDHYRKYVQCTMCRFATTCSSAYTSHMLEFHSGSKRRDGMVQERPMAKPMYCLCGYRSFFGNGIANHLISCSKRTCYIEKPEARWFEYDDEQEEFNPFEHDDEVETPSLEESGSPEKDIPMLFGALGLVKKQTKRDYSPIPRGIASGDSLYRNQMNQPYLRAEESAEPSSQDVAEQLLESILDAVFPGEAAAEEAVTTLLGRVNKSAKPGVERYQAPKTGGLGNDTSTEWLTGAGKWNTVRIKDPKSPTKVSIFFGGSPEKRRASQQRRDHEEKERIADAMKSCLPELAAKEGGENGADIRRQMKEASAEAGQHGVRNSDGNNDLVNLQPSDTCAVPTSGKMGNRAVENSAETIDDAVDAEAVALDDSTKVEPAAMQTNDFANDDTKSLATDGCIEAETIAKEISHVNGQPFAMENTMETVVALETSDIALSSEIVSSQKPDVPLVLGEVPVEAEEGATKGKDEFPTDVCREAEAGASMETRAEQVQGSVEQAPSMSDIGGDAGLDPDVFDFLTSAGMGASNSPDGAGELEQDTKLVAVAQAKTISDVQSGHEKVDSVFGSPSQTKESSIKPETLVCGLKLSEAERPALEAVKNFEETVQSAKPSVDQSVRKQREMETLQEDVSVQSIGTPVQDEPLEEDLLASSAPSPAVEGAGSDMGKLHQETIMQEASDGIKFGPSEVALVSSDFIQQSDCSSSHSIIGSTSVESGIKTDLISTSSEPNITVSANGPSTEEAKEDAALVLSRTLNTGDPVTELASQVSQSTSVAKSSHLAVDDSNKVTSSTGDQEDRGRSYSSRSDSRNDSSRGSSSREDGSRSSRDDRDRRRDDYHRSHDKYDRRDDHRRDRDYDRDRRRDRDYDRKRDHYRDDRYRDHDRRERDRDRYSSSSRYDDRRGDRDRHHSRDHRRDSRDSYHSRY